VTVERTWFSPLPKASADVSRSLRRLKLAKWKLVSESKDTLRIPEEFFLVKGFQRAG